jgi:hypothetical protein
LAIHWLSQRLVAIRLIWIGRQVEGFQAVTLLV